MQRQLQPCSYQEWRLRVSFCSMRRPHTTQHHLTSPLTALRTAQDIVVLSGAHTVGRAHMDRSGLAHKPETKYTKKSACPVGTGTPGGASWTPNWVEFDNSYFKLVKEHKDAELLVLETDAVLFEDEKFKCGPFVLWFACMRLPVGCAKCAIEASCCDAACAERRCSAYVCGT
jgi:Peroxidase